MSHEEIPIPEETHVSLEFKQSDLPGFATVNSALQGFEPKIFFSWHLSILIACEQLMNHRLPSPEEQSLLYEFENKLDPLIKAKRNAVFFARVTHDAYRVLVWRVHNPEIADAILREILRNKKYPREFEYRIDEDPRWEKAAWYLDGIAVRH
ncbi:DUF695 domain-containing protein [Bradyrhizobium prioriisuperbiae]|uniref:DUF695 domain-containing protein n=1 Tax=Bradyrhizobium prioriisuperbiae TaxID=2854389 RepID=UPI003898F06F